MRKRICALMVAGAILLNVSGVFAAQDYVNFDFRDRDIKDVVTAIAAITGVNIITEKSVGGRITLRLKDVYYEKALELIAKTNGYTIRKEDNTYIIGEPRKLAEGFDVGLNRPFRLQYAKAQDAATVISTVFSKVKDVDIEVTPDERTNSVVVTGTKGVLDKIEELIRQIDVQVHQVMIEAKIVEVSTEGDRKLGFSWLWGTNGSVGEETGKGKVYTLSESQAKRANANAYNPALSNTGSSDPFSFGDFYRGPNMFDATLQALETAGDTKVLSNPKIATLNGLEASIQIGDKVIYGGGPTHPPQEKDVGVILKITPRINDDGWVTTELEPEVSIAKEGPQGFPRIERRTAKTTVRVKNGEEILIGGMIQETQSESQSKIPVLGSIPLLKTFFSHKSTARKTSELIILVTPRVIYQTEG